MGNIPPTVLAPDCKKCEKTAPDNSKMEVAGIACKNDEDNATKCYSYKCDNKLKLKIEGRIVIKEGDPKCTVLRNEALSAEEVKGSTKPVLYMRKMNAAGNYYCCKCFMEERPKTMMAIMMDLHNHGKDHYKIVARDQGKCHEIEMEK